MTTGSGSIDLLVDDAFDVTARVWVLGGGDGEWTLTIASKAFDDKGPIAASRAISTALQRLRDSWVSSPM